MSSKNNNSAYIASVIASYWFVSISMVYLNKTLMSGDTSIPAPMFITWYQCLITVLICWLLGNIGEITRKDTSKTSFFSQFPKLSYDINKGMKVMPLSLVFVGMIACNQLCLHYVNVSFYNVARSLSIVFNVMFTYLLLNTTTSMSTCATLLVVIAGFFIGIDGEIDFSFIGTVFGVISSIFVSLNGIFTAKILPIVDGDKSRLIFYNNCNACILFLPLFIYFEWSTILSNYDKIHSLYFWFAMTITASMGFLIGIVTVMQVKATSPLTHNISGTAKAAVQSLIAFKIWGNTATTKGILGIFTVIAGSGLYSYVQMKSFNNSSEKKKTDNDGDLEEKEKLLNHSNHQEGERTGAKKDASPIKGKDMV